MEEAQRELLLALLSRVLSLELISKNTYQKAVNTVNSKDLPQLLANGCLKGEKR